MEQTALPQALTTLLEKHFPLDADQLVPEATFEQLGMDSMAMLEVVARAEEDLDVEIPEHAMNLTATSTLADAARLLRLPSARGGGDPAARIR